VYLAGCEGVCDQDVRLLAATCHHSLVALHLQCCSKVGDAALRALAYLFYY
jgi:hypothetical protein